MTRAEILARFPRASEATIRANLGTPLPGAATLPPAWLTNLVASAPEPQPPRPAKAKRTAIAVTPAGNCRKCGGAGLYVRTRHFEDGDAHVFECQSPNCSNFHLIWHVDVPKAPKRQRVAKTRNGATLTEAAFWGMVRSGLRRTFRFWKPALAALKAARVPFRGPRRQKWAFLCADCQKLFLRRQVQIDHVVPVGALRDYAHVGEFLRRLTPERPEDFACRCKKCHQTKTNAERVSKT